MAISATTQIERWEANIKFYENLVCKQPIQASQVSNMQKILGAISSCMQTNYTLQNMHRRLERVITQVKIWHIPTNPPIPIPKDPYQERVKEIQKRLQGTNFSIPVQKLLQRLIGSPHASVLLHDALVEHAAHFKTPIKIILVSKKEAPFGGVYNSDHGGIKIDEALSFNNQISVFIFELINVTLTKAFNEIHASAKSKVISSPRSYALAKEWVEYGTSHRHYQLIKTCVEKEKWDPSLHRYAHLFKDEWKTFEGYCETQKENGHFKYYEDQYLETYK